MSALVEGNSGSRIMATTRNVEVAEKVGEIYNMQPLSDDNSRMLFETRTCVAEGVCQDNQPHEVTAKILKKCDGVPLAIITIASLLVDKQCAQWSEVYDAIGFEHGGSDEVLKNTMKILSFSYYDLPSHLKACLLYLNMFPEDHFIVKKQLIWRWIIEGFIPKNEGRCSYELGENFFNMLVNRSLIRWIEPDRIFGKWQEGGGCRVHDMVLEFICTMSHDLNFITVHDIEQHGRVRRLALHGRIMEHKSSSAKEHVRSFYATGYGDSRMPVLLGFKVLRVLIIEECGFFQGQTLEHLGKLIQLRYLGLVKIAVKLPEGIGHDLKFLEILNVRGGTITELPVSIGELRSLRCLWADEGTRMKGEIGKLTCLEELQLYSVDECPNFFSELGKLTNLRVVRIGSDECEEKALAESVCNLHKIQSLNFFCSRLSKVTDFFETKLAHVHVRGFEDLAPSSRFCHFFPVGIVIPRMPSWINSLCVPVLCELWLHVEVFEARDLHALGRLPALMVLYIFSKEEKHISYTFGSAEFQKLIVLGTNVEISLLEEGALPKLETLTYSARAGRKDSLTPWINSCPLLDSIRCQVYCANSGRLEVKEARVSLRIAEYYHRNAKNLNLFIEIKNYNRKTARLIDALGSILHGEKITADQGELRRLITSLETLLRDAVEPQVGRYGEQELRGFVTKFKTLLHDDACTDQEEEVRASTTASY
jgi:disease resistance protein RPM1